MPESLGQKQQRFALSYAKFVIRAHLENPGLSMRDGEARRSDEQAEINAMGAEGRAELVGFLMPHYPELARRIANNTGSGIRNSVHEISLARDQNVFMNGAWCPLGTEPIWEKLGVLWESMGPDHRWGGRFKDYNHFSFEHEGRK